MEGAHPLTPSEPVETESELDQQRESNPRHRAPAVRRRRVLVTGSRDWWNQPAIAAMILRVWLSWGKPPLTLVHGNANGADRLAAGVIEEHAKEFPPGFFRTESHPADWVRHGRKSAGHIRNQEMVDSGADLCLAFQRNASRGTAHCMTRAEAAGIPVLVLREDGALPTA